MTRQVFEFTLVVVQEGATKEEAWQDAMQYLAEYAGKGDLHYGQCELLPDDETENDTTAVIDRAIAAIDAAEGRE